MASGLEPTHDLFSNSQQPRLNISQEAVFQEARMPEFDRHTMQPPPCSRSYPPMEFTRLTKQIKQDLVMDAAAEGEDAAAIEEGLGLDNLDPDLKLAMHDVNIECPLISKIDKSGTDQSGVLHLARVYLLNLDEESDEYKKLVWIQRLMIRNSGEGLTSAISDKEYTNWLELIKKEVEALVAQDIDVDAMSDSESEMDEEAMRNEWMPGDQFDDEQLTSDDDYYSSESEVNEEDIDAMDVDGEGGMF